MFKVDIFFTVATTLARMNSSFLYDFNNFSFILVKIGISVGKKKGRRVILVRNRNSFFFVIMLAATHVFSIKFLMFYFQGYWDSEERIYSLVGVLSRIIVLNE